MFKKAMNKFFDYRLWTRFLVITIACAIIFAGYLCIFHNFLDKLIPQDSVYDHFNELATEVIYRNSVDFLENSEILNYYTVTENSQTNTITVTFVGYHSEKLELVLSTNYTLVELNKINYGVNFAIAQSLSFIIVFVFWGAFGSIIINVTFSVSKWLYDRWIKQFLTNLRAKINFKKISFKKKVKGKYATQNHITSLSFPPAPVVNEDNADEDKNDEDTESDSDGDDSAVKDSQPN